MREKGLIHTQMGHADCPDGSHSRGSGGAQPAQPPSRQSQPPITQRQSKLRGSQTSRSRSSDKGDGQSEEDEWMDEDEPGPDAPSRQAFELNRQGCVCVVNVTVPWPEAPPMVVEPQCLTDLAKDLANGPGSLICVQRATQSMVTQLNRLPAPDGYAQKFNVLFRGGLLIAARNTLTMAVDGRMEKEWTGTGSMLVADVHFAGQWPVSRC